MSMSTLHTLYREYRSHSPFMLVGSNAKLALSSAKTHMVWDKLEAAGLVKIEAGVEQDPDASFYDTWEHLSERSREELKERYYNDCWCVVGYYRTSEDADWELADSIGNCSGYRDATSPFENPYVIDIMSETIDQLRNAPKDRCPVCRKPV